MAFIYDLSDTWNNGSTTFTSIKMDVTDTASAAASELIALQVGSTDQFTVRKDGQGYFAGDLGIGTSSPATITAGITALSISDSGAKTTGDKIGELNFITNDGSFTGTYSDGIGAAINAVSTSGTGAAYALTFTTATTTSSNRAERLRITETGLVGVGVTSPNRTLSVNSGTVDVVAQFESSDSGAYIALKDDSTSSATAVMIGAIGDDMRFDAGDIEAARILSTGNMVVGKSATNTTDDGHVLGNPGYLYTTRSGAVCHVINRKGSEGDVVQYRNDNVTVGSVSIAASSTSYNTSSDARLKHDIVDAPEASDLIDGIQVRSFKWNIDDSEQRYGMVAQELVEVAPEAVTGEPEGDEMMAVDYSKLVPMLVKEVQSLRKRVAELEGK